MTKKQGEEFDAFQARVKERDTMMRNNEKGKRIYEKWFSL